MTCGEIPTKIISNDVGNTKLMEKYCDRRFNKWDKLGKRKHSG
jgi:hypothetical protein